MGKPRKPRRLTVRTDLGNIIFVAVDSDYAWVHMSWNRNGEPCGAALPATPKQARRLAAWLLKAADYLDGKDGGR